MKDPYKDLAAKNVREPVLEIPHAELERIGDSPYRSRCPKCHKGILMVRRNQETFVLEELDRCLLCGQAVRYLDIEMMREREKPTE